MLACARPCRSRGLFNEFRGEHRKAVFSKFCSNHRIFKHAETNRVSILCENVDLAKMQETMGAAETAKAKAADTVIDPIDVYIEVAGGK